MNDLANEDKETIDFLRRELTMVRARLELALTALREIAYEPDPLIAKQVAARYLESLDVSVL